MGIKNYIQHKRATVLMKKAKKMLDSMWEIRIEEKVGYDDIKIEKTLILECKHSWFKPEEFAKFLEVLMKECVKYELRFYGYHKEELSVTVKVKW